MLCSIIPVIEANAKFVVTPENIAVNVASPVTLKVRGGYQ